MVSRGLQDHAPILATVFPDVVALFARDAGIDARRLLGYAVAHAGGLDRRRPVAARPRGRAPRIHRDVDVAREELDALIKLQAKIKTEQSAKNLFKASA